MENEKAIIRYVLAHMHLGVYRDLVTRLEILLELLEAATAGDWDYTGGIGGKIVGALCREESLEELLNADV